MPHYYFTHIVVFIRWITSLLCSVGRNEKRQFGRGFILLDMKFSLEASNIDPPRSMLLMQALYE